MSWTGGRLDVPLEKRPAERPRDFEREERLAGAGLAFDEQRPLEGDGRVDGQHEIGRRDVRVGAFKTHGCPWKQRKRRDETRL
jgi:hypothetical protein